MSAKERIVSIEFDVNKRIEKQVENILKDEPISLPDSNHSLVDDYIRKIEGSYDVSRSKEDTNNAIDLLYIAYNTTPQTEGKIRSDIDKLMTRLVATQKVSALKMSKAVDGSRKILDSIDNLFPYWLAAIESSDTQDLKDFIGEDLFDLAEEIKSRAEQISAELTKIAETYDGIIDDTSVAANKSEQVLASELQNKKNIEKEIDKNNAERQKLQSLVKDLQIDISKYEKMANEYKSQAETAEERAFIMSIVRVGAEMLSATIPAITAGITGAATGGTSLIAASAVTTARQLTNAETASTDDDKTAEVIETKKEIADERAAKTAAERDKAELEKKNKELTKDKKKIQDDKEIDADIKAVKLEAVDKRIEDNEAEIKDKDSKISNATIALEALNASLKSLDKNLGKMTEKQEEHATNLRSLQMTMLNKVEAYETEKRTQAAELVKINALLQGQRTDEESIELAIKSLNLSLKALKRVREIIVEISFFFKSFADFMQQIMENSLEQSKMIQKALNRDRLTNSATSRIKRNTDDFFVTQTAEWQAVEIVSAKFVDNFNEGWSKLNKLTGTYIDTDELKSYLNTAAELIENISFNRRQASSAKLVALNLYRDRILAKE
jgi:chromosome segregation ATPase